MAAPPRRDPDDEAGGGDETIVSAEHGGAKPADVLRAVGFTMSRWSPGYRSAWHLGWGLRKETALQASNCGASMCAAFVAQGLQRRGSAPVQ